MNSLHKKNGCPRPPWGQLDFKGHLPLGNWILKNCSQPDIYISVFTTYHFFWYISISHITWKKVIGNPYHISLLEKKWLAITYHISYHLLYKSIIIIMLLPLLLLLLLILLKLQKCLPPLIIITIIDNYNNNNNDHNINKCNKNLYSKCK